MKRLSLLIIVCVFGMVSVYAAETATFIFKNGRVAFGEFTKIEKGNVVATLTNDDGTQESVSINKDQLTEVIFDSGEKLDLTLSSFPPVEVEASSNATAPVPAVVATSSEPISTKAYTVSNAPVPPPMTPLKPSEYRNPCIYAAFSAVIPGFGQVTQEQYQKGAIAFGLLSATIGGTVYAWSSTSNLYLKMEDKRKSTGSYTNDDFKRFTIRKRGAQIISIVTGVLYLVNIADAAYDAHIYNRCLENNRINHAVVLDDELVGYTFSMKF